MTALERVGVYVPGGKAVYPSSVLMNVVPAKVAGVKEIVMTTPPGKDGKVCASTLVAAKEAGVDRVYKVGGAQAIAALAFGTEIKSLDQVTSMLPLPKRQSLDTSALILSPDQVRFWYWQTKRQIQNLLQPTFCHRQNTMRWHLRF